MSCKLFRIAAPAGQGLWIFAAFDGPPLRESTRRSAREKPLGRLKPVPVLITFVASPAHSAPSGWVRCGPVRPRPAAAFSNTSGAPPHHDSHAAFRAAGAPPEIGAVEPRHLHCAARRAAIVAGMRGGAGGNVDQHLCRRSLPPMPQAFFARRPLLQARHVAEAGITNALAAASSAGLYATSVAAAFSRSAKACLVRYTQAAREAHAIDQTEHDRAAKHAAPMQRTRGFDELLMLFSSRTAESLNSRNSRFIVRLSGLNTTIQSNQAASRKTVPLAAPWGDFLFAVDLEFIVFYSRPP